jgi:capsid protein
MHTTTDKRRVVLGPDGQVVSRADIAPCDIGGAVPAASAAYGSFQGADVSSRDRGYVWIPELDTMKEVDAWSHTELLRRARFVYNNGGGLAHRAVNGVARMVCGTGLFPYPLSKDKKWNAHMRRLWAQQCESKNTFDLSRKFTCGAAQQAIVRAKKRDGDVAPVLARDAGGRLRVMFYEANQIGMGGTEVPATQRWHHGVRLGQHNAPVAYRILGTDGDGRQTSVDVPAENVLFCAEYERFGQVRGLTAFYPCINQVLDRGEIYAALTRGIKQREQVGYAIEQEMPAAAKVQVPGAPGAGAADTVRPTTLVEIGGKRVTLEKFFGGAESHELKPGQSYKIVESDHPDANVREHLGNLERSIAAAMDWSVELLWNITQLGGANTRFIMADAQSKIESEQQALVEQFLGPWYVAWVRDMIEADLAWEVDGWELHAWLLPKRLTVDFGRDGKLHIEQWKRGMITLKSLYGFVADEWEAEIDQYLNERKYIKDGLKARDLTWQEGFPETFSQPAVGRADGSQAAADETARQIEEIHEAIARMAARN